MIKSLAIVLASVAAILSLTGAPAQARDTGWDCRACRVGH